MSPKHSIDYCPICGGGLCGVRVCGLPVEEHADDLSQPENHSSPIGPHGLIVCDECEAIWLDPDTSTDHQYPSAENAKCPVCNESLWGKQSRWASLAEIDLLGWKTAVNHALDMNSDEEIA